MDRKSLAIIAACIVLFLLWNPITNHIFPPHPAPRTNILNSATGPKLTNNAAATNVADTNFVLQAASTNATTTATVQPSVEEKTVTVENENARYIFTSKGGGMKLIELKKYPEAVGCKVAKDHPTNENATLNTRAPSAVMTLLLGDGAGGAGNFALSSTGNVVRAERQLENGVYLIKEFEPSTNYLVKTSFRFENRSTNSILLPQREVVIGASTPMGLRDESLALGFEWYNGSKADKINDAWFANRTLGCLPGTPRTIYEAGDTNVVWAAVHNQFFTIIALPQRPADKVAAHKIELPPPTRQELADNPRAFTKPFGFETALVFAPMSIPAQQALTQSFLVFAGPKEYNTLAKLPENMDLAMGFGRFFGFFAKALLLSMNAIASIGVPYGLTIIIITVIIKTLFWPLTKASNRSMKRMAALQPQMKALQEKYKDDPRKMQLKLSEFWKEHKVNPMAGCIPVVFQIPVFIGFYQMLQSAIELRGARFLWACDLSQPDTLFYMAGFPVNPLPLMMGATMLWQASLTPPSPGMDPAQQKIMKYMPLMMVVFLYNFSAGLTLYWTVQNLLSIVQMKLTKALPEEPNKPRAVVIQPKKRT